jgi:nucleotidyltransferase substrate binding protein (TIGR01987 family)
MEDKKIILTPFREALASLELALQEPTDDVNDVRKQMFKDSIIQRFEYTYELAWKMIKRCLEHETQESVDDIGRRDLFRRAFEFGWIENPETWFAYQEARNLTSHAYDRKIAQGVFDVIGPFAVDAKQLLEILEQKYA